MNAWTVMGAWVNDEPIPLFGIQGNRPEHGVESNDELFSQGQWATYVDGEDWDEAKANAILEMRDVDGMTEEEGE